MTRQTTLRISVLYAIIFLATLFASGAHAEERWSVRVLGVNIGTMKLTQKLTPTHYRAQAQFRTVGLAGAIAKVRFRLNGHGKIRQGRLYPDLYNENMNTGERQSQTSLKFENGRPLIDRSRISETDIPLPKDLGQPLDPLSAMVTVLRPLAQSQLCTSNHFVFDGERQTKLTWSKRLKQPDRITCFGSYDRIAGYSAEQLSKASSFDISVEYHAADGMWVPRRAKVVSLYGPVTMVQKD